MRTAVFLCCFVSSACGLHRLNESDHHKHLLHHTTDTLLPTLALSFNYTHPLPSDASARRLTSFFKLAHSRVTLESDIRATATALAPLYEQLCASVADCDSGVMELLADHQNELQLAADRMDRLRLVLNRVRKAVHKGGGGGRKHHHPRDRDGHRGLWRQKRRPMLHQEA